MRATLTKSVRGHGSEFFLALVGNDGGSPVWFLEWGAGAGQQGKGEKPTHAQRSKTTFVCIPKKVLWATKTFLGRFLAAPPVSKSIKAR